MKRSKRMLNNVKLTQNTHSKKLTEVIIKKEIS